VLINRVGLRKIRDRNRGRVQRANCASSRSCADTPPKSRRLFASCRCRLAATHRAGSCSWSCQPRALRLRRRLGVKAAFRRSEPKRLPSGTFQRDTKKKKCPWEGHFILAEIYLCCLGAGGRIVILDSFVDPWGCFFQIFQVHGRMEFDLRIESKEPGLGHGRNL